MSKNVFKISKDNGIVLALHLRTHINGFDGYQCVRSLTYVSRIFLLRRRHQEELGSWNFFTILTGAQYQKTIGKNTLIRLKSVELMQGVVSDFRSLLTVKKEHIKLGRLDYQIYRYSLYTSETNTSIYTRHIMYINVVCR